MELRFLRIKIFLVLIILLSFGCVVHADTIYLKGGKVVEGKIVEKTDKYIKIDFLGTTLTYWQDEIEKLETGNEPVVKSNQNQDAEAYFKKGTDYLEKGKWQEAVIEFNSAIDFEPSHIGSHFNLGCAYALLEDYDKAIQEIEKALSLEGPPFNAFCYFNIAGFYAKKAMRDKNQALFMKASENFKKAAEILPNFILAIDYARSAEIYSKMAELNKVSKIMFGLPEIGLPPDSAIFLTESKITGMGENRACFFDKEGPPLLYFFRSPSYNWRICESKLNFKQSKFVTEDAKQCFESILNSLDYVQLNQMDKLIKWNVYILLSEYFLEQDEIDKAIEVGTKAKDIGLNYSTEYSNLAGLYFKKGDYEKANSYAKKALEINPQRKNRKSLEDIINTTESY